MRIIFAGTPEPAVVALEALIKSEHEVLAVITRPDAPKGRGKTLSPSPVGALCEQHNIPVYKPSTLRAGTPDGDAIREVIDRLGPDCIPVVAYGNLVPADLLDAAPHGWVNLHFSLLPRWRGAAPVQAAIKAGDSLTGASVFRIEEGLDTGPVITQMEEEISRKDTADDLLTRLAYAGADLLVDALTGLEKGELKPYEQQGSPTYASKISKDDARVDWDQDAPSIDRAIRAYTPGPGAWTMMTLGGRPDSELRVKLGPVSIATEARDLNVDTTPGAVTIIKNAVYVGTGTDPIRLGMLQVPGKKMMDAADWARGRQDKDESVVFE
ncbi:MAG: methionyl-tRNA formyltransferase [Corynebacterium sp.]|nr:methionyl-tRNA formyltransferase [Corynebacterium sp.]